MTSHLFDDDITYFNFVIYLLHCKKYVTNNLVMLHIITTVSQITFYDVTNSDVVLRHRSL